MRKKRGGFELIRSGFGFLLISLLVAGYLQPAVSVWAQEQESQVVAEPAVTISPQGSAVADDDVRISNFVNVDWEQSVILPQDLDLYRSERDKLEREQNWQAIQKLEPLRHELSSEEALNHFRVPEEVRQVVKSYLPLLENKSYIEKNSLKLQLKEDLEKIAIQSQPESGDLSEETNEINLNSVELLNIKKAVIPPINQENSFEAEAKTINKSNKSYELNPLTIDKDWQTTKQTSYVRQKSLFDRLFSVPTANADEASPIINFYPEIEKNPFDLLLYYLSQSQNEDGSFGENNRYEQTAELAILLGRFGLHANDQFQNALNYLMTAKPKNNREKAVKVRMMVGLNQPYTNDLDNIILTQNSDGGFGINKNYGSDVLTTLQVVAAAKVANHRFSEIAPDALKFVLNQIDGAGGMRFSNDSDPSNYLINQTATFLYPYRDSVITVGGAELPLQAKIDQLLANLTENFSDEEIVANSNLSAIDLAMFLNNLRLYERDEALQESLLEKLQTLQQANGSFGRSVFASIKAAAVLADSDLEVVSITPTTSLINKTVAGFEINIKNNGYAPANAAKIHIFIDNFNAGYLYDCANNGIIINPGESRTIVFNFNNTTRFVGDTNFKIYAENARDLNQQNNWLNQNFVFAPAANNTPALQTFFVAGQLDSTRINVRWPKKTDPNRYLYVIAFRAKGTTQWGYIGVPNDWGGAFVGPFNQGEYEISAGVAYQEGYEVIVDPNFTSIKIGSDINTNAGNASGKLTADNKNFPSANLFGYFFDGTGAHTTDANGAFFAENITNGTSAARADEYGFDPIYTKFTITPGQTTDNIRLFTTLIADEQAPEINRFDMQFEQDAQFYNQQERNLLIEATDNISVKIIDIYYYDPASESWNYLGSEAAEGSEAIIYPWFVPDYVLGSGYKLRAVARDYLDNSSLAAEWGPFTVQDGTPPKFTLTAPNGGEEWPLGSTQTIRWNLESVNSLGDLSLRAVYPNNVRSINASSSDNGQRNWVIPNNSYYAGTRVKVEIEGEDSLSYQSGKDESDDYFTIVDNSPVPAAPWDKPEPDSVADNLTLGACLPAAMLAKADSTGKIHDFYHCRIDTLGTPRVITDEIYRSIKQPDGTSETPELVYRRVTETDGGLTGYQPLNDLSVIIDANNNPHLMWLSTGGVGCDSPNLSEVYYTRFNNGSWLTAENISLNATVSDKAAFAITQEGNVHVVWRDGITWNANCTQSGSSYMVYRRSVENSWFPVVQTSFATNFDYPAMAVTTNNKLHLLYSQTGQTYHVTQTSGAWGTPLAIAGDQLDYGSLASNGTGLHYAYNQYNSGIYTTKYVAYSGTNWTQPETLTAPTGNLTRPKVVINNGSPHILYYANTGQLPFAQLFWTVRKNDGTYTSPQRVNLASQDITTPEKTILLAANNKLYAKWLSYYEAAPALFENSANLANFNPNPQPPSFGSLTTSKPSIVASGQDIQTVTYRVNNGEPVNKLYLSCNHDWHKEIATNPKCFYLEWTTAGGFKKYNNNTVNAHVEVINEGPNASRRIVNPDGSVDFIFSFVMKRSYAGSLNNTVSVITYWGESSAITWKKGSNNFDIQPYVAPPPSFGSLTASKPSIVASGQDVQTVTYRINDGEPVNKLYLSCNHDWHKEIATNPKCFYFEWTASGGFKKYSNNTVNAHVDLITSGANPSRRVVNPDGSVDFIFNFVMKPTYAGSINNTVSAITYWGESSYLTWRKGNNNFDIEHFVNPEPNYNSLVATKSSIIANGQDMQTITYKVNKGEPVNKLYLACNHDWHKEIASNPKCFYFEWTTAGGFKEYNATTNAHVDLITSGANASRRVVNPDGSVDFIFNFVMKPTYAGSINNTISVITYWGASSYLTWRKGDNNFDIQPQQ